MCVEKRLTAPAAPAPASKGGWWQTLTLSVAQWPIATRIVLLALLPLLALGIAGGLWLRGQMQQALWGGFDQALQDKAQRVAARLQLGLQVVLQIEDDGPGMAPHQLQAAGQRGLRFDDSVQGSGLGLHIATQMVQAYGGDLSLGKSALLKGLSVRVVLPGVQAAQRPRKA